VEFFGEVAQNHFAPLHLFALLIRQRHMAKRWQELSEEQKET
jgi:hypothetical protein